MQAPTDEFRAEVFARTTEFEYMDDQVFVEDYLASILEDIERAALGARDDSYDDLVAEDALELLAAVESWASVVSYTTARAYAPSSPWPNRAARNLAGWGAKVLRRIQRIIAVLMRPLSAAAKAINAIDYAIGISFPWSSVSVSFTWQ